MSVHVREMVGLPRYGLKKVIHRVICVCVCYMGKRPQGHCPTSTPTWYFFCVCACCNFCKKNLMFGDWKTPKTDSYTIRIACTRKISYSSFNSYFYSHVTLTVRDDSSIPARVRVFVVYKLTNSWCVCLHC